MPGLSQGVLLCHKPYTNNKAFPNTFSTYSVPPLCTLRGSLPQCLSGSIQNHTQHLARLPFERPAGQLGLGDSSLDVTSCCKQEGSLLKPCFCVCAMLQDPRKPLHAAHRSWALAGRSWKRQTKSTRLLAAALLCTPTLQPHDVPVALQAADQGPIQAVLSTCRTVRFVYGHTASSSPQWLQRWPPFVCVGLVSSLPVIPPASATHTPATGSRAHSTHGTQCCSRPLI